jgi:ubiquinone/menaquinone biosynthesis C-methylase UbiE
MTKLDLNALSASYDAVADEYVNRIFDELKDKPLDRELLDRISREMGSGGTTCDMGCGPGHVARYLHDRGVPVVGLDLSAALVACARRLNPGIEFHQGNMLALHFGNETFRAIVAFYSIIHVPRILLPKALSEFWRVLQPGGALLLAFHVGDETKHLAVRQWLRVTGLPDRSPRESAALYWINAFSARQVGVKP